jgi:hypothetical protein
MTTRKSPGIEEIFVRTKLSYETLAASSKTLYINDKPTIEA